MAISALTGEPHADHLAQEAGDDSALHDLTAVEWLEATPLMRKLRRLQAEHAGG
jgi:hypothetical protein